MKCPECGRPNDEGVSICQHCDAILDPSFLGDDYTDESDGPADLSEDEFGEDTPPEGAEDPDTFAGPAPAPPARSKAALARHVNRFVSKQSDAQQEPEEDDEKPEWEDEEFAAIERQRAELRTKRGKGEAPHSIDQAPAANKDMHDELGRVQKDMEQTLGKISEFFKKLEKADRIAILGALGMLIFPLFPWVNITSHGSLAGFEVGGWFLMLLAACAGTLIYLRQDEHWQGREKYILYVQVGVAGISVLFLLARMFNLSSIQPVSPEGSPIPSGMVSTSMGIGLMLSLLSSLAVAGGTFLLFRAKVLKK